MKGLPVTRPSQIAPRRLARNAEPVIVEVTRGDAIVASHTLRALAHNAPPGARELLDRIAHALTIGGAS